MPGLNRRGFLGLCAAGLAAPARLRAAEPIRLGLTPVFLDNDAEVIARLKAALGQGTGRSIELVQRRTYQEVTGLLLEGVADAAWLCGYPYLQNEAALALLGVPVWRGQPLYQSYLITGPDDPATGLADLRGGSHAFSDPDSNSGWLVTASDLARLGERPETFFQRTLFTYGHRNVVRAVAGGLMRSGSVDGYVWEALTTVEPGLTARTKVIARSERLGFPPFVAHRSTAEGEAATLLRQALLGLADTAEGRAALALLQLDGVIAGEVALFDGIRARMRDLQAGVMGFRRLPLSLRVPLIAAGLMVLVGIVASRQVLTSLGAVQEERLRELARLHVDGLAVALGPSVLRHDVWEVYDTLDRATQAMAGQRMVLTVVADETGRVIAASDPRRAPVDSVLDPLMAQAQGVGELRLSGDDPHVRVLADLSYQGRRVGRILSELDVADLAAERRRALVLLLAGNALATAALASGGYLAVRRMLRPVAALSAHMAATEGTPQAIAETLVPSGDPELARLFQTFNAMTGAAVAKAEAERRLAERERFVSLGRLSSSLAHEINNPLGGLLNATDTIRAYADRPEVVRDAAALIDRGLRHLRDVARVTLEQNRLDRSGQPLAPEDFDDLRLLFAPEVQRQGQTLDWQVAADGLAAWPSAEVRQVALNLLLNASTAAGPGGAVGFAARTGDDGLQLTVADSGPGLSPQAQTRLLTDGPVPPGGGVGLRLVRDLVAGLGGRIDYRRDGARSQILVSLPAAAAPC